MSDLKMVNPGHEGYGILIEHDSGFIAPDDIRNKPFITEISKLSEGGKVMAEPLILFVVLQKYGVLNKNGRMYPERLLRRGIGLEKTIQILNMQEAYFSRVNDADCIIENNSTESELFLKIDEIFQTWE
jgi:hypothetical protein